MKHINLISIAVIVVTSMVGCDNQPDTSAQPILMPEVNDKNCAPENITQLDASIRTEFADACLRRGTFKPSPGKKW